jgi:HSP20 family protein
VELNKQEWRLIMSMIIREPFPELMSLRQAMDRLFEGSVVRPAHFLPAFSEKLIPSVDIYQDQNKLTVKATLPGLKSEDVGIDISNGVLTIKGEAKSEEEVKEEEYLYRERRYGGFCRSFNLPSGLQADKADATMEDGILTIDIPKAEEAKPRAIKIKAKEKK